MTGVDEDKLINRALVGEMIYRAEGLRRPRSRATRPAELIV